MQVEYPTSDDAIKLAAAMRQDAVKLWSYRCHRQVEMQLAACHVQHGSLYKQEEATSGALMMEHQEDKLCEPSDIQEEVEVEVLTEANVATSNTNFYSKVDDEEHVRTTNTVSREEATLLQDATVKMWQYRGLVTVENHYHEQLSLAHSTTHDNRKTSEDDNLQSLRYDKGVEEINSSHAQEDEVVSDSEESFHSLEDFLPDEPNELSAVMVESGSECYDDAERILLQSTAVQTTAAQVQHTASQTIDTISHSVCAQTDTCHLLDASVNTITMTTSNVSTNTIIITTDNAATNTITMVTVDNATNTDVKELVDMETNTIPKATTDAITQTEKLLVSRSQSEYESLIDKYKKYIEALKSEVTQEKSQRLVAEQMVTIVQSEVENLRQRNIEMTSQQIKLENELSETKV